MSVIAVTSCTAAARCQLVRLGTSGGWSRIPILRLGKAEVRWHMIDFYDCAVIDAEHVNWNRTKIQSSLNRFESTLGELAKSLLESKAVTIEGQTLHSVSMTAEKLGVDGRTSGRLHDLPNHIPRFREAEPLPTMSLACLCR